MAIEVGVYTAEQPLSGAAIMSLAAEKKLELRFVVPMKCVGVDEATLVAPLKKRDFIIYCWSTSDAETTSILDKALAAGDTKAIVRTQDTFGWFDFRCERYDYEKFWKKHEDERGEFEASTELENIQRMRSAIVRYFFRAAFRPKQCGQYLQKVVKIIADATNGYIGE
jgi:hypothetical protein